MVADPYAVLGVEPDVSDAELRSAYRRLVQLHHPDHNGGSLEAATRFEAVQSAYSEALARRRAQAARAAPAPTPGLPSDPAVEARLAALERELREQRQAAARAAAAAAAAMRAAAAEARRSATADSGQSAATETERSATGTRPRRPTPEELGYITTEDSLGKIIADAEAGIAERFTHAKREAARSPLAKRLTDLFTGPHDE